MDIEKAKEVLNRINDAKRFDGIYTSIGIIFEAIKVLLNELEKYEKQLDLDYVENELDNKDKIIIAMAEQLTTPVHGIDWVIDYFTKKVEGK